MTNERWFSMCISEQILNIGGEVSRAVSWERKGREAATEESRSECMKKSENFLLKAISWINLSKADPKNVNRIRELEDVEMELLDYFGENTFSNDSETIMDYWNSFNSATCVASLIK